MVMRGPWAGREMPLTSTSRWTRCTRTATREVYFYNQDNGETVWSLPLGGVIVAELAQ